MKPNDLFLAAARCWERAGHLERAAERYAQACAWADAGRCWAQAKRHVDSANAYARAGDFLSEARQWLTSAWPTRAHAAYLRVLKDNATVAAKMEALLGVGNLDGALRSALDLSGGGEWLEGLRTLARLTACRGRPDVAIQSWNRVVAENAEIYQDWEQFTKWNRSLQWKRPFRKLAVWPASEPMDVKLLLIWKQVIAEGSWGARALSWSADATRFAAALSSTGVGLGRVNSDLVQFEKRTLPSSCVAIAPEGDGVVVGFTDGEEKLLRWDGFIQSLGQPRGRYNCWSITFSPEGDEVAVSVFDGYNQSSLRIFSWNPERPERYDRLLAEFNEASWHPICSWSPSGQRLVWSPDGDTKPLIFVNSANQRQLNFAHGKNITNLPFTPDGCFLISASVDRTVVLRDAQTGQPLAPQERFDSGVTGASVHPQAALLAIGEGRCIHLLRLHVGVSPRLKRMSEHLLDELIRSLDFSPDGRHLLVMTSAHLLLFRVDLIV